jgi:hypothetical protein
MFGRKSTPEARELRDAKRALRNDPVNNGSLGVVDQDSPAGRRNAAAQDRVRRAEAAKRRR